MLQSFFRQNKISLTKLVDSQLFGSSSPTNNKVCCQLFGSNEKVKEYAPIKSPNPKRRKIFQQFGSPESECTAQFGGVSQGSEVQAYRMVSNQNIGDLERKAAKKKYKTSKQNGFCLVKNNHYQPRQVNFRSEPTITAQQAQYPRPQSQPIIVYRTDSHQISQQNDPFEQNKVINNAINQSITSNRSIKGQLFQDSLMIDDGRNDIFTFSNASSLQYSYSDFNCQTPSFNNQTPSFNHPTISFSKSQKVLYSPFQMKK